MVEVFKSVEIAINQDFHPALLGGDEGESDALFRTIMALPTRHSGIGIFCGNDTAAANPD